jgi:hypothetical protein
MRVALVLAAPVVAAAVIPVAAGASVHAGRARPAAAAGWGKAEEMPGTAAFYRGQPGLREHVNQITCTSAGNCEAAGNYSDDADVTQPFVARQVDGTWHPATLIPGMLALSGQDKNFVYAVIGPMSCTSAGNCVAGGDYNNAADDREAFLVTETNGTWHKPVEVPGTAALNTGNEAVLSSVSCASAGNCSAGGFYSPLPGKQQAFVADEVHGTWQPARIVPGTAGLNVGLQAVVTSVVCSSAGDCTAGGSYAPRKATSQDQYSAPFVVSERNGRWGTARQAPGRLARAGYVVMRDLSCASAGNCTAVGILETGGLPVGPGATSSEPAATAPPIRGFAVSQVHGTWRNMVAVKMPAALSKKASWLNAVSCTAAGDCTAGGIGANTAIIAREAGGTWHTATVVSGLSAINQQGAGISVLSCSSPGTCSAAGGAAAHNHDYSFVVSEANGKWSSARQIASSLTTGSTGIQALSCTRNGFCSAGGYYDATPFDGVYVISRN